MKVGTISNLLDAAAIRYSQSVSESDFVITANEGEEEYAVEAEYKNGDIWTPTSKNGTWLVKQN